jgi:mono/diheme cytochrome c family protein
MTRPVLLLGFAAVSGARLFGQGAAFTPEAVSFFETRVAPVLAANCSACHNQRLRSSNLALDSRAAVLTGGNRGPSVKPGSPNESVLMRAVEQTGDLKMPLGKRLSDEEIATLRKWIQDGVAWTAEIASTAKPRGADHWAFQAPKRAATRREGPAWVRNPSTVSFWRP